jgi:hypothetical protein
VALYETALSIISDASVEMGLGAVSDAYGSTDANVIQLRTLLKTVGRRLALSRDWSHLVKQYTFTTDGDDEYDLPADFSMMVPGTSWNRTTQMRGQPVNAQAWQYLKASNTTVTYTVFFRMSDLTLTFHPDPPSSGETIAFEYRSRYWVTATGQSAPNKDAPTANTDTIEFDATLMVPALKLAFLQAKGFDATAAKIEYDEALERVAGANVGAAPILSLGAGSLDERLLDESNAPSSGFGLDGEGGLH